MTEPAEIEKVIEQRKIVAISIEGQQFLAEPWLVGIRKETNEVVLRVWQPDLPPVTMKQTKWRDIAIEAITAFAVTSDIFSTNPPRPFYDPNDATMRRIDAKI